MRVTMTPERAAELLRKNNKNRNISKDLVEKYVSDLKHGLWQYNGDAIRVAVDGTLLDGQHRLQACVQAKLPFDTEYIDNLPQSAIKTIDGGRKRRASDVINILHGSQLQTSGIAASARQVLNYVYDLRPKTSQSTSAIVDIVEQYPALTESFRLAYKCSGIIPPGPLAAVLFIGTRAPTMDKRAMQFVHAIPDGAGLDEGDPRLAARNYFINYRLRTPGGRSPPLETTLIACALAWNAFSTQKLITAVKPQPDKSGRFNVPSIVGGPARGGGVESLSAVKMHANQVRAVEGEFAEKRRARAEGAPETK